MTGRDALPLDDTAIERLLTGGAGADEPDLRQALAVLDALNEGPPPRPSAALADVLDRGFEPEVVPFRRPAVQRRRWAVRAGAGLAAAAASVVLAGTAAALPPPVQETVADVISALTPFELPRPPAAEDGRDPAGADDDAAPSATPGASALPSSAGATAAAARSTEDSTGPGDGDQADGSSAAERQERDRQRAAAEAAEESQRAAEESQHAAEDAADDAADDAEDTADEHEDAAHEHEDAADEAEDEAEDEDAEGHEED